jgi:hypothetical protein
LKDCFLSGFVKLLQNPETVSKNLAAFLKTPAKASKNAVAASQNLITGFSESKLNRSKEIKCV